MPPGKTKFQVAWLNGVDGNNQPLHEFIKPDANNPYAAVCLICNKSVSVANQGQKAIFQHSSSNRHVVQKKLFKEGQTAITSFIMPSSPSISSVQPQSTASAMSVCSHPTRVSSRELMLSLIAIENHISYASFDRIMPALKMIDPSSKVFEDMTLGSAKISYIISDGIGPYFKEASVRQAKKAVGLSWGFDTATTKHHGLAKEVDIRYRFWNEETNQVCDRLFTIIEVGKESAEVLQEKILTALAEHGFGLKNIFSLSRDNPAVNSKLVKLMTDAASKLHGAGIVDVGSCPLHPAHTAFQKGLEELSVNVSSLCQGLHGFFKYSVIRREEFTNELFEYDLNDLAFLRHVPSRWLSLGKAAARVAAHFPAIQKYFLRTLPANANDGDKNAKEAIKTKYYNMVQNELNKDGVLLHVKFVVMVTEKFRPFLISLQSDSPQIHRLHHFCSKLLHAVLSSFLKLEFLPNIDDSKKMLEVDIAYKFRTPVLMSPSMMSEYEKLSDRIKVGVEKEFRSFYIKLADYLRKNLSPLNRSLPKYLSILDPELREKISDHGTHFLIQAAKAMKRFNDEEIDTLVIQFVMNVDLRLQLQKGERIDNFYIRVFKALKIANPNVNFSTFEKFIKLSLCLFSSQASVERGFNESKILLHNKESLSLSSIISQRIALEMVHFYGGAHKVPLTSTLIVAHGLARQRYRQRIEEDKQRLEKERKESEKQAQQVTKQREKVKANKSFQSKKRHFEQMEENLKEEIAYYETVAAAHDNAGSSSKYATKVKTALLAGKKVREEIATKRAKLEEIRLDKMRIFENQLKKLA